MKTNVYSVWFSAEGLQVDLVVACGSRHPQWVGYLGIVSQGQLSLLRELG